MKQWVSEIIEDKKNLLEKLTANYIDAVELAGKELSDCLKKGGKILLAGNGGSAADAQHFAGEIVGRFTKERRSLPAFSLCVDPSVMTCIGNDYGYSKVFARQLEGLGNEGDFFIAISTSGNSENLINALKVAKSTFPNVLLPVSFRPQITVIPSNFTSACSILAILSTKSFIYGLL